MTKATHFTCSSSRFVIGEERKVGVLNGSLDGTDDDVNNSIYDDEDFSKHDEMDYKHPCETIGEELSNEEELQNGENISNGKELLNGEELPNGKIGKTF